MKNNAILNFLFNVLKGGLIGIAAVIPGFSGGTIACVIGAYDDIVFSISDIRKDFLKSVTTLLPIFLGAFIFALLFISPITWGIDTYPLITISLFVGLLFGGLPSFCKEIEGKLDRNNILVLVLSAIVVLAIIIPSLFMGSNYNESLMHPEWYTYIILFILGIVGSCALIVPGISGSMILLLLGFYNPIMDTIKGFLHSIGLKLGDFSSAFNPDIVNGEGYLLQSFSLLFCFGLGIIAGAILISKLMKFLLQNHKVPTYFGILGFILASVVGIYANGAYYQNITYVDIILAIIFMIAGFFASFYLAKLADQKEKEKLDNIEE